MQTDFKQQLRKAYDKDAGRRDSKTIDDWKAKERQRFLDLVKSEGKTNILELGSGTGRDASFFQENGLEVMATDLSQEMVNKCLEKGLIAKVVDFYDLSILGKKFDAVFSLNVLLHVPRKDLKLVLKSIADALKDKAIFYYGVYGGFDSEETFTDESKMNLPRFFSYLSNESLLEAIEPLFEVINFETIDFGSDRSGMVFQSMMLRKK